jgi:hypothetical protein
MTRERLTADFVHEWSAKYDYNRKVTEKHIFSTLSRQIQRQGYYTLDQFAEVGEWKSSRTRSLLRSNDPAVVREITGMALAATELVGFRVLTVLRGVQAPIASALLAVWRPKRYTIIDFRAVRSLRYFGALPPGRRLPAYLDYLAVCRRTGTDLSVELRPLDKALWKFDERRFPRGKR